MNCTLCPVVPEPQPKAEIALVSGTLFDAVTQTVRELTPADMTSTCSFGHSITIRMCARPANYKLEMFVGDTAVVFRVLSTSAYVTREEKIDLAEPESLDKLRTAVSDAIYCVQGLSGKSWRCDYDHGCRDSP